ncbi:Transcription factor TRY [Raphanus sativus]|uniref:Transcription factor TRY n=1 Tax=Raphanus sativus TaxID=3726 RepID=A0A6J0M960_RAPSA|nr:transcription factor TRY [Raphanus sativus]KAJ4911415.1 Transcription factor TRY [Raphanus sativus]
MDNTNRRRLPDQHIVTLQVQDSEEVSSIEWKFINMTEQEEDIILRMYRLVGDRWDLIAGRVPGRQPEEIERYWIMRNSDSFAEKRLQLHHSSSHKNNKLHRPRPSVYPS